MTAGLFRIKIVGVVHGSSCNDYEFGHQRLKNGTCICWSSSLGVRAKFVGSESR